MADNQRGIILMNLGSPDSTAVKDVHRYLMEFLMDRRVIDYPYLLRKLLVGGMIVPFRAAKSAEAYKTIWTGEGSPLIVLTKRLRDALQVMRTEPVEIAMRYGSPDMETAYSRLLARCPGLSEVLAIPLYPHYAMSSYETAVEHAREVHARKKYSFHLRFLRPYYNHPLYIEALSEGMKPFLDQPHDHLLFSYHGIPERHIRKTDPTGSHCLRQEDCCNRQSVAHGRCYRHQVFETTRLVCEHLRIPKDKYSISFQSRLGKGWLQPFTDVRLEQMPGEGIRNLVILCPAFVSDCLETLEEIAIRGKESFEKAGGQSFTMIPCMNTHPSWVNALDAWIGDFFSGSRDMLLE
jgi:ferrochelatase